MGYPDGLLSSRAVVKAGEYAVIPPEGRVINVLPGFTGCRFSILASPKMGASFVFYIASVEPGGGTTEPFCPDGGIEGFYTCWMERGLSPFLPVRLSGS
jgi:(S)-ureidoglycine aminohydrolase